jgi:hypothetical protein
MKRVIVSNKFITLRSYLCSIPRLRNNKKIAMFLEKNSMRLLDVTYIVVDTSNILFAMDLCTVE